MWLLYKVSAQGKGEGKGSAKGKASRVNGFQIEWIDVDGDGDGIGRSDRPIRSVRSGAAFPWRGVTRGKGALMQYLIG